MARNARMARSPLLLANIGRDLTVEQGDAAARLTALSILGRLQRALGDLDRISAWARVFGMVNSAPGFQEQPSGDQWLL
jgi:hypothetical protein